MLLKKMFHVRSYVFNWLFKRAGQGGYFRLHPGVVRVLGQVRQTLHCSYAREGHIAFCYQRARWCSRERRFKGGGGEVVRLIARGVIDLSPSRGHSA